MGAYRRGERASPDADASALPETFRLKHRGSFIIAGVALVCLVALSVALYAAAGPEDREEMLGFCAGGALAFALALLLFLRSRYAVVVEEGGLTIPGRGCIDWGSVRMAWLAPPVRGCLGEGTMLLLRLFLPPAYALCFPADDVVHVRYGDDLGGTKRSGEEIQLPPLRMSTRLVRLVNDLCGHSHRKEAADGAAQ